MQSISTSVVHVCTVRYFHTALIRIGLVIVFFYFFLDVLFEIELLVKKSSLIPHYFAYFNKVTVGIEWFW